MTNGSQKPEPQKPNEQSESQNASTDERASLHSNEATAEATESAEKN